MLLNELFGLSRKAKPSMGVSPSCRCGGTLKYTKKHNRQNTKFEHKCDSCGAKMIMKRPTDPSMGSSKQTNWDHVGKRGEYSPR